MRATQVHCCSACWQTGALTYIYVSLLPPCRLYMHRKKVRLNRHAEAVKGRPGRLPGLLLPTCTGVLHFATCPF
jgi:hypothetical protein